MRRYSHDVVHALLVDIAKGMGSQAGEAKLVADHLVRSSLCGHDSHGIGMMPAYVNFFSRDLLVPNTVPRVLRDEGAILSFAGDRGFGQRVAHDAMAAALRRAGDTGVCVMALTGASHIGRIGTYGEQAIEAGFVSLHFVNVVDHDPLVAPHRGGEARFGTNPICVAMPAGEATPPFLLDMATSRIALGKARVAMNKGVDAPDGSLIDEEGRPTNDPSVMFRSPSGALMPLGEHKGYGLAFAIELLAGALTGGGTLQPLNERQDAIVNHMLTIVIAPDRLTDFGFLQREIDAMADYVLGARRQDEAEPIQMPGDPERLSEAERSANGLPIDDTTWKQVLEAGAAVGVSDAKLGRYDREAAVG